jgi:hypothetical protein
MGALVSCPRDTGLPLRCSVNAKDKQWTPIRS